MAGDSFIDGSGACPKTAPQPVLDAVLQLPPSWQGMVPAFGPFGDSGASFNPYPAIDRIPEHGGGASGPHHQAAIGRFKVKLNKLLSRFSGQVCLYHSPSTAALSIASPFL